MSFTEFFVKFNDFNFELTTRGGVDFEKVGEKLLKSNSSQIIIDFSINGYTNKPNFDIEVNKLKWSEVKIFYKSGLEAQKDSEALTIKRAIRVLANSTSEYIIKTKCKTPLQRYNISNKRELCHLGAHFICKEEDAAQVLLMWTEFDKRRKTKIAESVSRIFELRFRK